MILRSNSDVETLKPHWEGTHWSLIMRSWAADGRKIYMFQNVVCMYLCNLITGFSGKWGTEAKNHLVLNDTSPTGATAQKVMETISKDPDNGEINSIKGNSLHKLLMYLPENLMAWSREAWLTLLYNNKSDAHYRMILEEEKVSICKMCPRQQLIRLLLLLTLQANSFVLVKLYVGFRVWVLFLIQCCGFI